MSNNRIYQYHDADGQLRFEIVRKELPNGKKTFTARRPDGNGSYINDIDGVELVLYNLPSVAKAKVNRRSILIVEGEKTAEAAKQLRLVATTNALGANKWLDEYTESLKGIGGAILLADNDEPGRRHMDNIARSLVSAGIPTKKVSLPGLQDKGDLVDWIQAGGNREKLLELVKDTPFITEEDLPPLEGSTAASLHNYEIDQSGIYYLSKDKKGNPTREKLSSPIVIVRATRSTENVAWGRQIALTDPEGKVHVITLPMDAFKGSGEEIWAALLEHGASIARSKSLRDKLADYLLNEPAREGYARCTDRSGWHGDSFVLPDGNVLEAEDAQEDEE